MSYLILFSIGPVQEFIASARRSRDLWFGSWLLSELSKAAARQIVAEQGTLIFPAPTNQSLLQDNSEMNVANKIVAIVDDPAAAAKAARKAVISRLHALRDDAYGNVPTNYLDVPHAYEQVDDLVEYTWVAAPLVDEANYPSARTTTEALLAARKATRTFGQVTWGLAGVPKSSLDGARESVVLKTADRLTESERYRQLGLRVGEQLCGVGMLKRRGRRFSPKDFDDDAQATKRGEDRLDRFFSTSHVAALPLIARLRPKHQHLIDRYINFLKEIGVRTSELGNIPGPPHPIYKHYDGHLLFAERLHEYIDGDILCAQAKRELRSMLDVVIAPKAVPCPYYALLLADGDRMGETINHLSSLSQHQALSRTLALFARNVADIVILHNGSLVYAGGDDVLAFVPLHTVLACARALAEAFQEAMQELVNQLPKKDRLPTLSVGIAMTHHLEPLSDALALARSAEKAAKSLAGKNALAVRLSKRSGEERTIIGGWGDARGTVGALDQRLALFTRLFVAQQMPDGYAYEIQRLFWQLTPRNNQALAAVLQEPMKDEAKRILDRKRNEQGRTKLAPDAVEQIRSLIDDMPLNELADELMIARTLAEAYRQANV